MCLSTVSARVLFRKSSVTRTSKGGVFFPDFVLSNKSPCHFPDTTSGHYVEILLDSIWISCNYSVNNMYLGFLCTGRLLHKVMNIIELTRKQTVDDLYEMNSFEEAFEVWQEVIQSELDDSSGSSNFRDILDIADHLEGIFESTGEEGRGQATLASAGHAWEALVCWYMNLCLVGTRGVVVKPKNEFLPECISNATTVNYGTFQSNSESDLVAIVFPEEPEFEEETEELLGERSRKEAVNDLCEKYFEKLQVGIIQCKTNWNDVAQIPMLWDMIYSSEGFGDRQIHMGREGFTIKDLERFFYSFVTVPTQDEEYDADSVIVKRVEGLSGGNYWGRPSKSGVADSLKEIFNRNFSDAWGDNESHGQVVEEAIESQDFGNSYFKISF